MDELPPLSNHVTCTTLFLQEIVFPYSNDNGVSHRAMADAALKFKAVFDISSHHITVYP